MPDPSSSPPISDRSGVTDAVRVQILATEHWSLLANRALFWNEVFSRASMFLTVLSAAVVALALVAQATGFGPTFRLFALLVLPVVLLVGVATFIRVNGASADDLLMVIAMNRVRHAYLQLAPELEPYFTTSHYDDEAGIMRSLGLEVQYNPAAVLSATPPVVGAITVVVGAVLAALIAGYLQAPDPIALVTGIVTAIVIIALLTIYSVRGLASVRAGYRPRFPTPADPPP